MNETLILVLNGATGIALGAFFFGGLWWTIRKAVSSPQPALWFLGSLVLRMGVVLAGFYFFTGGAFKPLLACLFGFLIGRILVTRLTHSADENTAPPTPEANHAT